MTAPARGGAPEPNDDQAFEGTGPGRHESALTPPPYNADARWNRYKMLNPSPVPDDRELWAILPAALVWDRTLPARAVRLYGGLYLALYDPRDQTAAGWIDPHQIAASVRICPSLYRRYAGLLAERGWIKKRRTSRTKGHANMVYVSLNIDR